MIPVSGGKDSFYQIIKCKEMGLKPLCVNATTCDLTNLGKENLEAMKDLNVDIINVHTLGGKEMMFKKRLIYLSLNIAIRLNI